MKLNKKGFMMAEVIITCSIVVIALVSLFTSYNKTYLRYKERRNYYNIDNAYACNYLKEELIENNILYTNTASYYEVSSGLSDNITALINAYNISGAWVIDLSQNSNIENLIPNVNNTYKDYLKYLNNSIIYDLTQDKYLLIVERRVVVNDTTNYYYGSLVF